MDLYQRIFEFSRDALLVIDQQGRVAHCNAPAERMFGYSRAELTGQSVDILIPLRRFVSEPPTEPSGTSLVLRGRRKDGSEFTVDTVVHPIELASGRGMLCVARDDIGERRQVQESLRTHAEKLQGLFELSQLGIALCDMSGRYIEFNEAFREITGYSSEELKSLDYWALTPKSYEADEARQLADLERTGRYGPYEKQYRRKDGTLVPLQLNGIVITGSEGQKLIWSIVEDITERKNAERILIESEARMRMSVSASNLGVMDINLPTDELTHNYHYGAMLGLDALSKFKTRMQVVELIHPDDRDRVVGEFESYLRGDAPTYSTEYRIRTAHGDWKWIASSGAVVERDPNGAPIRFAGTHADVSERKKSEEQLRLAASVFESTHEAIVITDWARSIVSVNRAFLESTGFAAADVIGRHIGMLNAAQQEPRQYAAMWRQIDESGRWRGELWRRRAGGATYPTLTAVAAVRNSGGAITHYIDISVDITQHKRAEEHIWKLAHVDPLTGVSNRMHLQERAQRALATAQTEGTMLALVLIDLDRFKNINDSLGHMTGDRLLQAVAERLQRVARASDTVSRLGGDEFLLLCSVDEVEAIEHIVQRLLKVLGSPYRIDGHCLQVTPSVGIGVYPRDGASFEDLLKSADTAMYKAKESGRNTFRFFTPNMHAAALERLMLENDLRQALAEKRFVLHYQPQIDLRSGALIGVEALIRWHHPKLGLVLPAKFIPIAEETDLILSIGAWAMREACRQMREWQDAGVLAVPVAVNLSARQLARGDLVERVGAALHASGLPGASLEIEITESMLIEETDQTLQSIRGLEELGVKVAMDDFGIGYSNLSCLKRFPLRRLKIDRSLVRELTVGEGDHAIVSAIISMGHSLGLRVLAEGVESNEQLAILRALECDEAQGYLYGKPMPAAELERLLKGTEPLSKAI
ncbi:MAG TPA: EAL domain-containing protein [Steroidobacteraceae bacterium]|nr:EAL domain-containing protein [Steroidobacteraceae bacterium]